VVDADSGMVHTVVGTAANVNDVTQAHALVHGKESDVFADTGYQGVEKRDDTQKIKASGQRQPTPSLKSYIDFVRESAERDTSSTVNKIAS
jgi:transposase, IS5 family